MERTNTLSVAPSLTSASMFDTMKFWGPPVALLALSALFPSGLVFGLFCLIAWLVHGILTQSEGIVRNRVSDATRPLANE